MLVRRRRHIDPEQHAPRRAAPAERRPRAGDTRAQRRVRRLARRLRLRRRRGDRTDPWVRFRAGLGLLAAVIAAGTGGYVLIGLEPFDAVYQTIITISTVGYSEARVPSPENHAYEVFTLGLILFGTGTALYTVSVLMETLFEGRLDDRLRRRHMRDSISQMTGHTVVCGYGQVGRAIVADLAKEGCDVVVVDRDAVAQGEQPLIINAEATEDETLVDAGIERASTLVLAFSSDVANLYVTLSARSMRPDLFIVARTNSPSTGPKLQRAGADRVINPNEIGAARMAAMARRPGVMSFFDEMLQRRAAAPLVTEFRIPPESGLVRARLGDSVLRDGWGGALLAIGRDDDWLRSPPDDLELSVGDVLILLGNDEQLSELIDQFE